MFVPMLSIHVDTEDVLMKKHSGNPPTGTYILDIKDLPSNKLGLCRVPYEVRSGVCATELMQAALLLMK